MNGTAHHFPHAVSASSETQGRDEVCNRQKSERRKQLLRTFAAPTFADYKLRRARLTAPPWVSEDTVSDDDSEIGQENPTRKFKQKT